jgi:RNA polymerase sigma factor (sigma-70 family)
MRRTEQHSRGSGEAWPDGAEFQASVRTAQQGEPRAVNALLARLRPWFLEFFAREVDRDTADDLTQDALLGVLGALPRLDPGRASGYVKRVAQRRLWWASRGRARDAQRFAPIEAALHIPSPVRTDREAEYADLVRAAATLPPRVRACVLETLGGLSPADIAAAHGVSPTTVRLQLKWARPRMQAALGLSGMEPHSPPGPNTAAPRQVRETTRFPYPNKRFPELRTMKVVGASSRLRRIRVRGGFAHHAPGDGERGLRVHEERTGNGACAKQPSHARAVSASAR